MTTRVWLGLGTKLGILLLVIVSIVFDIAEAEAASVKINDASNFGTIVVNTPRNIVRTSSGTLYAFVFSEEGATDHCEIWKSTDGAAWVEQDSANKPICVGAGPSGMAIDSTGVIHLLYQRTGPPTTSWRYRTFITSTDLYGPAEENVAAFSAPLTVDSNNKPHLAYYNGLTDVVTYKNKVSGSWSDVAALVLAGGTVADIIIDKDNLPIIAVNSGLKVLKGNLNDATAFTVQTVDATTANGYPSLGVDTAGNTWVAYVDENGATDFVTLVKHNYADAWGTWQAPVTNSVAGVSPSIAINGSEIYVFYQDANNDVAYDKYTGSWLGNTVLQAGTFRDVKAKWSYYHNNQGGVQIDYSYSDSTDIFWDNLNISVATVNISGTCHAFDQSTVCSNLGTIKVAVDGVLSGQTDPGGGNGGTWALSNVVVAPGSIITVFIDGAADADEAVAVTKVAAAGPTDITGMKLYKGHLVIGSSTNMTITNTDLESYDHEVSADEDIFFESDTVSYTCDGNSRTGLCTDVTGQFTSAERLYVDAGDTFAPGGDVQTSYVDVRGTYNGSTAFGRLVMYGVGTNTTCGSTTQMPLCVNGGTFTAPDQTYYRQTSNSTVHSQTYQGLFLYGRTNFTLTAGTLATTGTSGDIYIGDGVPSTTVNVDTNDPVIDISEDVQINNGGTLVASASATFTVAGNWTNNGDFTDSGGTVTFDATDTGNTLSGQMTGATDDFNVLTFNGVGGEWTLAANMDTNTLNVTNGTFDQGASFNISTDAVNVATGGTWQSIGSGDVTLGGDVSNLGVIILDGTEAGCGDPDVITISGLGVARNWSGSGQFILQDLTIADTGTTVQGALSSVATSNNIWVLSSDCSLGNYCGGIGCVASGQACIYDVDCCSQNCDFGTSLCT